MGLLGDELQSFSVTASKKTIGLSIRDTGNGNMQAISKRKDAGKNPVSFLI
jgi:hypothetical protein